MALDEQGNPIPGTIDALGSLQWPPPEWGYTVPAPLETTLGPRGTGSTIDPVPPPPPPPPPPEPGNGRKGGSSSGPSRSGTEQVGPLLSQGGEEVPFGAPPGPPAAPDLPPLPPPAVDAVSGPGAMPPMPSDAQPQMPASYLSDDEAAVAKGYNAPTDTVAGLSDENLGRAIANLPPEEQAVLQQKHEAAKANFVASRMLEENQRTLEQQQQNAAAYQQAQQRAQQQTDQIMLESDRLASVPTDRNRWANRSAPTAIAGLLGAIVGGLMQPYTGGRNSGLDALLGMVDKDVDDQKFDAEQKRQGLSARGNLVAEQLQRSGNMYQAAETVRLSHYQTIINGLQAEAQKFDPRGTTAMNIAQSIQGVRARQAQAAQALFQQNLKDEAERAKKDLDLANAEKARAETMKIKGQLGGAGKPVVDYGAQYASLNEIPEKLHDRAYRLPSGKYAIANSTTSAQEATTFVKQYKQLDYNLNELQKLSTEREGAKSVGGSFSDKWKTDDEQHYKQLLTDAVNRYGMMIHGRSPTSSVLEEVLHSFPDLKSAWERGDTTYLLGKMRDDIDNRGTLELGAYGADEKLRTTRPKPAAVNVNTLSTPLLEKPVKGDAGFARLDVANANQQLNAISQQYLDNPRLGEGESYQNFLGRIEDAQRGNAEAIRGELATLEKKAKRTPAEDARLANDAQALADREELIKAIADAKTRDIDAERAKATADANRKKDALERPSTKVPAHFEKL